MGQVKEPIEVAYEEYCHLDRVVADGIHQVAVYGTSVVWTLYRKKRDPITGDVKMIGVLEIQLPVEVVEPSIRKTREAIAKEGERFGGGRVMLDS